MTSGGGAGGGGAGAPPPSVLYGSGAMGPKSKPAGKKSTNKNANAGAQSVYSFVQYNGRPVSSDRSAVSWGDKDRRMMARIKVPDELKTRVDVRRVNLDILKPWISGRITELLGVEDDVVILYVFSFLDDGLKAKDGFLDPKAMQVYLTGFLEKNTGLFMKELWGQLASAQSNPSGIPQFFIDVKQREVDAARAAKVEQERLAAEASEFARRMMQANLEQAERACALKEEAKEAKKAKKSSRGDGDDRRRHRDRHRKKSRSSSGSSSRSRSGSRSKGKRERRRSTDRSKSRSRSRSRDRGSRRKHKKHKRRRRSDSRDRDRDRSRSRSNGRRRGRDREREGEREGRERVGDSDRGKEGGDGGKSAEEQQEEDDVPPTAAV